MPAAYGCYCHGMITLFTDYGLRGPYTGQVETVLYRHAPAEKVINLVADAPRQNPRACAYLLAALTADYPAGSIFFCVVDPGVGSFRDDPVVLKLDERWYVGPDNGLFDIVARRAEAVECWKIHWRPENLSTSFHGRDLYAPISAMIANGLDIPGEAVEWSDRHNWPDDLEQIIYVDHFGNCMTGLRAAGIDTGRTLLLGKHSITHATTFSDVEPGKAFWYRNSIGLVELAVNQGHAASQLDAAVDSVIRFR